MKIVRYSRHLDDKDNLLYEVTRLAIFSREGWIAAFRSLVTSSGVVSREEKVAIHVANIYCMTAGPPAECNKRARIVVARKRQTSTPLTSTGAHQTEIPTTRPNTPSA